MVSMVAVLVKLYFTRIGVQPVAALAVKSYWPVAGKESESASIQTNRQILIFRKAFKYFLVTNSTSLK